MYFELNTKSGKRPKASLQNMFLERTDDANVRIHDMVARLKARS